MGKAANVTMLMGIWKNPMAPEGPDYAQEDYGYRKERPSDMPEDQKQGYDHQHSAQGKDRAVAAVHQPQNSGLERTVACDGGAIACRKFCKIDCIIYFQKEALCVGNLARW